ncbi:MAG: low molecular weight protein arginine phosphatase [Spartobacteria bacterium]|nr:low molecular weight protein arginine phosphatase [Spartobacteria bacterium]
MEKKHQIVFVCTGNICRSPMAEYILRHRLGPDSAWQAQSAGVAAWPGSPASREAVVALKEIDIDLTPHFSQPLTPELVDATDLIVVMTNAHRSDVLQRFPAANGKVFTLHRFGTVDQDADVADPIGGSVHVYKKTRDEIDSAISDLILYMKDNWDSI